MEILAGGRYQRLLTSIFSKEEVEAINTIPISNTNPSLICRFGGALVQDVSQLRAPITWAKEIESRQQPEGSAHMGNSEKWRILWALLPIQNTKK